MVQAGEEGSINAVKGAMLVIVLKNLLLNSRKIRTVAVLFKIMIHINGRGDINARFQNSKSVQNQAVVVWKWLNGNLGV